MSQSQSFINEDVFWMWSDEICDLLLSTCYLFFFVCLFVMINVTQGINQLIAYFKQAYQNLNDADIHANFGVRWYEMQKSILMYCN